MSTSAIEWTDATWNPVTGCDRVSPGCAHCYALDLAARLKGMGQARYQRDGDPKTSGPGFGLTLHEDKLAEPLRWRKPRMVFVNSMSDLFHEEVPDEYIARVFAVMATATEHTFQVLTKRPERMKALLSSQAFETSVYEELIAVPAMAPRRRHELYSRLFQGIWHRTAWPLPNVWLGTSIENRRFVHRADVLRDTPAAIRFISAEPLLGPLVRDGYVPELGASEPVWSDGFAGPGLDLTGIDWLIAGGESGPNNRPMRPEWVRDLRDACQEPMLVCCRMRDAFGRCCNQPDNEGPRTAFFFKQWGGRTPKAGGRELDGRTWDEMPVVA